MTLSERIAYLSSVWKNVCNVFPYFDRLDINFDRIYFEYIDRILTVNSDREFCLLVAEFLNLLGDGHTDFSFPPSMREEVGFLPFSLRYVCGAYYIDAVQEGSEQFLWAKVESINGESFDDLLGRAFRYIYHTDGYAYPSKLHAILPFLLKSSGNSIVTSAGNYTFDLMHTRPVLSAPALLASQSAYLPVPSDKVELRMYNGNILYANIPTLTHSGAASDIAAALQQYDVKGVVLDLRENEGGMTVNGARIAELFISGEFSGCQKRTRIMRGLDVSSASQYARMSDEIIEKYIDEGLCDREELERCRRINTNQLFEEYRDSFGSAEHGAAFEGPCVLITSRNTISAAEDMVAMFRSNNRAKILGTHTHGSTGTPYMMPLSIGGGTRICSVGYRLLDGTEFIGTGIAPDIAAENSIDDLKNGFDRVLHQALRMFS